MSRNINDLTIFKYLFNLDNRNLPESILRSFDKNGNSVTPERKEIITHLKNLKGNCRNLVIFSDTFLKSMEKSGPKFTQFHKILLDELNGENGIIKNPLAKESYILYSIEKGCLSIWLFQEYYINNSPYLSIPIYHVCMSPNNSEKSDNYEFGYYHLPLVDNTTIDPLFLIHLVLDYLCLRQWAEVQMGKISTNTSKQLKKLGKKKIISVPGLDYYTFDCKWYTEIFNNSLINVSGHFRLVSYKNGTKKLKWIKDYVRNGYHRKATIDKVKSGEVTIS